MASIDSYTAKAGVTMYRARIQRKGHKTQTAVFPTLREARRYATLVEGNIIAGRHFPTKSTHTLSELLDRYTAEVIPRKSQESQRSQMSVIRYWRRRLGHMLLDDIQPKEIIACRDEIANKVVAGSNRVAPATVVKYLMVISHAFTVAMTDYQWTDHNPCRLVRKPALPPGRVRYLTDLERHRLLQECRRSQNRYLYKLVVMALYTGLRRGSLFALTTTTTDVDAGILALPRSKNGSPITLPLIGEALTVARELVASSVDGYLFPRAKGDPWCHYRTAWDLAVQRARVPDCCFHSLRHCTASYLVQLGIPIYVVSQILTHTKITTTQRYAHLHIDQLKDALETLSHRLSS
jgi:integrase